MQSRSSKNEAKSNTMCTRLCLSKTACLLWPVRTPQRAALWKDFTELEHSIKTSVDGSCDTDWDNGISHSQTLGIVIVRDNRVCIKVLAT